MVRGGESMFGKVRRRINQIVNNQKGSTSIYFIIFMIFFLPFAIWVGVHLPVKYEATYTVKQMTSNTADSIVSRLDKEALSRGVVWIDPVEAEDVARRMIQTTLNLDDDWFSSEEGILNHDNDDGPFPFHFVEIRDSYSLQNEFPIDERVDGEIILPEEKGVYVYVLNGLPYGEEVKFKGLLPIDKTSVIVRANIPVSTGSLFGVEEGTVISKTGVSEAQIYIGEES